MGVFVVYVHWEQQAVPGVSGAAPALAVPPAGERTELHQFFYIETTEIGIESYKSVWGDKGVPLMKAEQSMVGGLGAIKIDLTEREARLLIREYAAYNKKFGERLPEGESEYSFILNEPMDGLDEPVKGPPGGLSEPPGEPVDKPGERERKALLAKICAAPENDYELINYFLMRYYASDADAVRYLTAPGYAPQNAPDVWHSPDTLCLNKIRIYTGEDEGFSYICESLVESGTSHRITVSEISVSEDKVALFKIINDFAISDAETAMKLERPEFITVYEIFSDPEKAIEHLDERYLAAMQRDTDAGRLYLRFNDNNDHMKNAVYRLNDDVKGMIYVTDEAQLVLAAYSLSLIHRLEREAQGWPFCRQLRPVAKYEFKEDIFYDFVRADTGDFIHYVNDVCDFDPDER
jgi:hypothetical protein